MSINFILRNSKGESMKCCKYRIDRIRFIFVKGYCYEKWSMNTMKGFMIFEIAIRHIFSLMIMQLSKSPLCAKHCAEIGSWHCWVSSTILLGHIFQNLFLRSLSISFSWLTKSKANVWGPFNLLTSTPRSLSKQVCNFPK